MMRCHGSHGEIPKQIDPSYWAAHVGSVGALLAPGQMVTARGVQHHNPLQTLPPTLLLWEMVHPSSPFHSMASLVIHFSIQSRTAEPWNELVDLLLFLGGLGSVREGRQIEKLAYVMGEQSTTASMFIKTECTLKIHSQLITAGMLGNVVPHTIFADHDMEKCLEVTRALGFY
ncbi:hypothetical protein PISMIDRAFT_22061 [Pisolithus microcarpus 441]|uniref:Unplaced genomic scaffold scaffold_11, whole genome shotgun sequence n=1 Tax=Pisolithus microcarpus 441 TaxID=765257 RepID=A0A0C9YRZ2_9AGAM|nr:hypothetical protein BKA83DRAFT_22061 [Pisolithus microcarpus]KIK27790.1 hypothetical protein PISMIDRAFT_22061 [Pisolithus microcarpus 441]